LVASIVTHNGSWYADKAEAFQYGYTLVDDTDTYAETDEDAQIIAHAAVEEVNGTLYMKVAKEGDDGLEPLSTADPDELTPFTTYINKVKDAGVKIVVVSDEGDDLRMTINIYYDPLVLDGNGILLTDSVTEPAKETIVAYIKDLPFNGEFVPAHLIDALQETSGVDIPEITSIESRYGTNDYSIIEGKVIPNAGYLVIADDDLTINYIANV